MTMGLDASGRGVLVLQESGVPVVLGEELARHHCWRQLMILAAIEEQQMVQTYSCFQLDLLAPREILPAGRDEGTSVSFRDGQAARRNTHHTFAC